MPLIGGMSGTATSVGTTRAATEPRTKQNRVGRSLIMAVASFHT
jgi:hypothetical protein